MFFYYIKLVDNLLSSFSKGAFFWRVGFIKGIPRFIGGIIGFIRGILCS